jgi:hypothetical protein
MLRGVPLNLNNPYMRFLAGIVAAVVAIRLVVELLRPVLPVLAVATVVFGVVRVVGWWRRRW